MISLPIKCNHLPVYIAKDIQNTVSIRYFMKEQEEKEMGNCYIAQKVANLKS